MVFEPPVAVSIMLPTMEGELTGRFLV